MNQKDFESLSKALEASRIGHSAPPVNPVVPADSLPIDLKTYCSMIQKIMLQIDECQSSLDQAQYARIREGIGKIHKEELIHYSDTYGDEVKMLVRDNLRESLFAPANAYAMFFYNLKPQLTGLTSLDPRTRAAACSLKCGVMLSVLPWKPPFPMRTRAVK